MFRTKSQRKNRPLAHLAIPLLFTIGLTSLVIEARAAEDAAPAAATTDVKVRDLVLTVPATWKKEEPKSRLRLGQLRIPAVGEDKSDAELAIFSFGASDINANIRRWIAQYEAPGRQVKITQGDAEQGKYVLVELSGTYKKPVGPPIAGKTEPLPGARTLAVILLVPEKGVYFLKLVGLDKTVAAQGTTFRKSFGADAAKEKAVEAELE